ncbi:hypothetical protein DIPPA_11834 [Diplonema papillatum]|nr:hypothetical protein DIPPA_11834 [Diplonema papillatum]
MTSSPSVTHTAPSRVPTAKAVEPCRYAWFPLLPNLSSRPCRRPPNGSKLRSEDGDGRRRNREHEARRREPHGPRKRK